MHVLSSRAARAGFSIAILALGACSDRTDPIAAPLHARRDLAAAGAVLVVTNTNGGALAGSLRAVVNQTTGGETIHFDPSLSGATITLDTTLDVPNNVTIEGPVDKGVTISGGNKFTVMTIHQGATLANLTITGGKFNAPLNVAGGILDTGALVVKHSTIAGNVGQLTGGIRGDNITLINSTVTNNSVIAGTDFGGGITTSTLMLINSSVSKNLGAGIVRFSAGTVLLKNSIIANNERESCNGVGVDISYEGVNISSDKTCGTPILNMIVANPLLGDLADNGGPTQTLALDRNSPAINATDCSDVTVDQRFVARDAKCDIGPFEFVFTTIALTIDPAAHVDPSTGAVTVSGTIQCSRDETFNLAVEVKQAQKTRRLPVVADATEATGVACGTTAQPWIAQVTPPAGAAFDNSDATVSVKTVDIANGVTPTSVSSTEKMIYTKKK